MYALQLGLQYLIYRVVPIEICLGYNTYMFDCFHSVRYEFQILSLHLHSYCMYISWLCSLEREKEKIPVLYGSIHSLNVLYLTLILYILQI